MSSSLREPKFTSEIFQGPPKSKSTQLQYKILLLIFDLHHFRTRVDSASRLEQVFDPEYLGTPYFQSEESDHIRNLQVGAANLGGMICETISQRVLRRSDVQALRNKSPTSASEKALKSTITTDEQAQSPRVDFRICAAHDLAPVLAKAFGINEKLLIRHKAFIKLVDKFGLEFPQFENDAAKKVVETVIQTVCVQTTKAAKKCRAKKLNIEALLPTSF
jgi:hypothetical protein